MSHRPICIIGNANLDLVCGPLDDWPERGTETFLPRSDLRIGGSAANTALVLQRLGARGGLVSAAGADAAGRMLAARFQGTLDRVAVIEASTSVTVGLLHPDAERTFLSTDGHLDLLDLGFFLSQLEDWPVEGALVLVSGAFAMPGLLKDHMELLSVLKEAGAEVAIDPGWPGTDWAEDVREQALEWIALADHVLMNDKEALGLARAGDLDAACAFFDAELAAGRRLVIKCGKNGALALSGGTAVSASARPLTVFDTVGAGDAFNAGYLEAVARGLALEPALKAGVAVAGRVIAEFPRTSLPIALEAGEG